MKATQIVLLVLQATILKVSALCLRGSTECVFINQCLPYMNLINNAGKPLRAEIVEFLRSQQCGFENGFPKVCCDTPRSGFPPETLPQSNIAIPINLSALLLINPHQIVTRPPETTTTEATTKKITRIKQEDLNRLFFDDFFDLAPFDLLRRRRNTKSNELDIEIR